VQAANLDGATAAVRAVGGEVTHQLGIINAVGAHLTLDEVRRGRGGSDRHWGVGSQVGS